MSCHPSGRPTWKLDHVPDVRSLADEPPPRFHWLCLSRKTKLGEIIAAHVAFFFLSPCSPSQACGEIQEGVDDVCWLLIQRVTAVLLYVSALFNW